VPTTTLPRVRGESPGGSTGTLAPPRTIWSGTPDPCSLLTSSEVKVVTGFDPIPTAKESTAENGTPTKACIYLDPTGRAESGYVSLTILAPGSPILENRTSFSEVVDLPGIGVGALTGHMGPGSGPNVGMVDMGRGGFSLGVLTNSPVTAAQMKTLLSTAGGRWPSGS